MVGKMIVQVFSESKGDELFRIDATDRLREEQSNALRQASANRATKNPG